MQRKYGLFTAICMIVGTVIGSGVFFKAQTILQKTEGNFTLGILAWIIGGAIMLACLLAFAGMAQKYEKVNGLVDYAEATVGHKYAYYVGWFSATVYLPAMTGVLAWLSARYTLTFITSCWPNFPMMIPAAEGGCVFGPECLALSLFFMVVSYAINTLSPKVAGKFQTSTTIIKFIPLTLMAVVGIIAGICSPTKMLVSNFMASPDLGARTGSVLLTAVCATSFAYEGWIITMSINAELKDSKKNLPKALLIGGVIVILTYLLYYIGVAGGASIQELQDNGATTAFVNVFGGVFGNILNLFVAISCMGTLNGLMLGTTRGLYALAARKEGPDPELFGRVDEKSNMPTNSAVIGLVVVAFWCVYFFVANLFPTMGGLRVFEGTRFESVAFAFDSSELPIVTIYALYIPIFIMWMVKEKEQTFMRRFVLPALAVVASAFMCYSCIVGHRWAVAWYLIVFALFLLLGAVFYKKNKKK